MNLEQVMLPVIRAVGSRPRLSAQLFRFAKWGNPYAPDRFSWPYPMYDTMTADGPVVYSRPYQQWFVSGYDEVLAVLRSPNSSTAALAERMLSLSPYTKLTDTATENFRRWLLVTDPPTHTRLRAAVSRAFTPNRIAGYEPRIRQIVDDLLLDIADDPAPDVVPGFTAAMPIDVIASILGLPTDDWEWLRASSAEIGRMLEAMDAFDPASMNRRFDELQRRFDALITERRVAPRDDLISVLVTDESELSDDEVVSMISMLMFAGHETTTGLMGNSIVALAHHPEQRTMLRSQPGLITNAIEELLRFDTTAQFTGRNTTGPIEAGDVTIPGGSNVAVMVGAANRDRRRWPDADVLRLDRPDPKPISFGHGIHHCLGSALARLEMRVGLPAFLESLGDYRVDDDEVEWKRSHTLRGPTRLIVRRPT
ncbi:cytochrome P450 [Ilumatobacter sp.]|uniref:cytochrome P450 n=1 Tax=Ilumatobacter sp. TaxID=1967498 RepID=UPI003C5ABB03